MKDSIDFDRMTFGEDRLGAAPRMAKAPFAAASARTRRIPDAQRRLVQGGLATVSVLALAACKGGGTTPPGTSVTGSSVTGSVVKGPIEGAFVFSDNDGDGAYDAGEAHDITDANGNFELADGVAAPGAPIIALLEGAVDTTSGHVYGAGETLSAPAGSTVVTPFTTLMVQEGMTSDDIAAMIGVDPATFDAETFNPYAEGADPALAVAVENRAQQVAVVVEGFTAVLVGAGMDPAAADAAVMEAVGAQASEGNALHDQATIEAIAQALIDSVATSDAVDAVLTALKADLVAAMTAVIAEIDSVDALSAGETTPAYQLLAELIAQAEAAAEAEAEEAGSGGDALTLAEEGAAADRVEAIATNHAPVLTLSSAAVKVAEDTRTLEILTASATDADAGDTVSYSLTGADADAFEIDAEGKVTFREQPDYETQSSYRFTVLADDGTETTARQVTVTVTDVDPLMQLTVNADVLETAAADFEPTAVRVDDANDAFFSAPSDWSATLAGILFSSTSPDVSVSSAGITIEGETGALRMVFDSFSPSSLEALGQVITQFENSQDIADLTISGGFRSIEVLDTDGDILAAMSHTASGIEFYVGGMEAGDMDKLVLNGSFGNQIADYIDLWQAVEANPSGHGSALTLLDGLNELIDATGVSMMAGDETLASVSLTTSGTAQSLSFSLGEHVFSITADGLPDLIAGMIDAAGGEEAFLDLAMAGFGATSYEWAPYQTFGDVTVHRAEHRVEHTIFDTTEETSVGYFTGTDFHFYHTYAQKDLVGGSHEETHGDWFAEINSISYEPASYWGVEPLSREEFDDLLESISGIQGYLDGFDGAINDLALGIDYSFDGDSAVSFDVERILDLIAAMEESGIGPDSPDRVAGEHTVGGAAVTELSDPGANWEVTLVGVGLDDLPTWQNGFLDSQAAAA